MLTSWGEVRISRVTDEGGGAAGDGALRSSEISGNWLNADWWAGLRFGSEVDLTAGFGFVVCYLTIEDEKKEKRGRRGRGQTLGFLTNDTQTVTF